MVIYVMNNKLIEFDPYHGCHNQFVLRVCLLAMTWEADEPTRISQLQDEPPQLHYGGKRCLRVLHRWPGPWEDLSRGPLWAGG